MKYMILNILLVMATCVFGEDNRLGLAVRIKVVGDNVNITINYDAINKENEIPRTMGVRQNTYSLPINCDPQWVGWEDGSNRQSVILEGTKYLYILSDMDRRENGTLRVQQDATDKQAYKITGVYYYGGTLFVINNSIKEDVPVSLYEVTR